MTFTILDLVLFFLFLVVVILVSLRAGRSERDSEDYFLAGRQLGWGLIGFSLIASNISTEHFVGMAGAAFGRFGLAIAAYEWMAAVMLIFVAWWLLPKFLAAGIYTMPEYLEYRYDAATRTIMATMMMFAYVVVFLATVIYSGAIALNTIFDIPGMFHRSFELGDADAHFWATVASIWIIGAIAGSYTVYGGLKAVVWSDLIQGGTLLLGGALVAFLGLHTLGEGNLLEGWSNFTTANADKLHAVLPWNHPDLPWIAVFVGGLWIPNLFYWGLNQFITQRTLAARNLAEGQKGIFFAAFLKLTIPFIIVLPGIMAYQLYGDRITNDDSAYPFLINNLLPASLRGVMFAALAGAVMSSFNSGVNSASTIFTIDIYKKYFGKGVNQKQLVTVGRIATAVMVVLACLWAPVISGFEGVFQYIQEIWGFISPGIVTVFLGGMLLKRAPAVAAKVVLLGGILLYGLFRVPGWIITAQMKAQLHPEVPSDGFMGLLYSFSTMTFLYHMFIIFLILLSIMWVITSRRPLDRPVEMPRSNVVITPHPRQYLLGGIVIGLTVLCYIAFW